MSGYYTKSKFEKLIREGVEETYLGVRTLDLSNEGYEIIPPELSKFKNLEELFFDNNYITSIPENIFDNMKNLKLLTLCFNPIKSIPENIFIENKKLKTLCIRGIPITKLSTNIFKNLYNLNELFIDYDIFQDIGFGLLNNLKNMRCLAVNIGYDEYKIGVKILLWIKQYINIIYPEIIFKYY